MSNIKFYDVFFFCTGEGKDRKYAKLKMNVVPSMNLPRRPLDKSPSTEKKKKLRERAKRLIARRKLDFNYSSRLVFKLFSLFLLFSILIVDVYN